MICDLIQDLLKYLNFSEPSKFGNSPSYKRHLTAAAYSLLFPFAQPLERGISQLPLYSDCAMWGCFS